MSKYVFVPSDGVAVIFIIFNKKKKKQRKKEKKYVCVHRLFNKMSLKLCHIESLQNRLIIFYI